MAGEPTSISSFNPSHSRSCSKELTITDLAPKRCSKCRTTKPRECFGNDRSKRDLLACWCKACLNENNRKYHAVNRASMILRHRQWRENNLPDREVEAERSRVWRKANPDHARALAKNGKHKRRARTQGGITGAELREWETAQPKSCHWCGVKCPSYEIDHRIPLSKGGKHERRNLVISCRTCNRKKGARCPVEFAQSLGKLL